MFHLGYLILMTHLCFFASLSLYIVLIDVLYHKTDVCYLPHYSCIRHTISDITNSNSDIII